jgi:hypothetical protein
MTVPVRLRRADGVALITTLMAMLLMLVLCAALTMITITETKIAENHRDGIALLYAAEAGIELAISDLGRVSDWSGVLSGATTSMLVEGVPDGVMPGGGAITLAAEQPSSADGRRWRPYVYGPLAHMLSGTPVDSRIFVLVWVGEPVVATQGTLMLRAQAYGTPGTRRAVEVMVRRQVPVLSAAAVQRLSWRER